MKSLYSEEWEKELKIQRDELIANWDELIKPPVPAPADPSPVIYEESRVTRIVT